MSSSPKLRVDWCSFDAMKFACLKWHYSKCVPAGKAMKLGAWENDAFIGVVVFSRGATPNIGTPYKLTQYEVCELTRIALGEHLFPVSKILSIAVTMLRRSCPGLRLLVSYADADQQHHGGIYQAANWLYVGCVNANTRGAFVVRGKKTHPRTIGAKGGVQSLSWVRKHLDPNATEFITQGKHKYLMPLDAEMRAKIQPLVCPHPKRAGSAGSGTPGIQPGGGGANPTPALDGPAA